MSLLPRLFGPRRRSDLLGAGRGRFRGGYGSGLLRFDAGSPLLHLVLCSPLLAAAVLWVAGADLLGAQPSPTPSGAARLGALQQQHALALAALLLVGLVTAWRAAWRWARARERASWPLAGLEQSLFEHSPAPVVVTDAADRIVAVNDAYSRVTGYSRAEVLGRAISFNHAGRPDAAFDALIRESLLRDGRWAGEIWLRKKNGETYADKVTRVCLRGPRGELLGYLTLSMDLLASDDARRLMLWQAHHDTLTRLPNRNLFEERLKRVVLESREPGFLGAVLSIDLDRFKMVNDSAGAAKADQLLMEVAYRLAMCVEEANTLARLGGDHFAVLMSHLDDYAEAERLGRRILAELNRPFQLDGRELYVSASVGAALLPRDGDDTGALLQKADAARIQVKEQGGNDIAFFEAEMNARAERRLELESALRRALARGELELFYQPVVDVRRGVVTSAEALLRWRHPELGMISPAEFVPVAEDIGLIVDIGRWVVEECHRQLELWRAQGLENLRISINVSPVQLRRDEDAQALVDLLGRVADDALVLELTESALMENCAGVQRFLKQVRTLGSLVALDDFGTGFSSLGYLRKFEFDVLKVDKTFIDELANTRDYGLVASIVSMGRILGMRIVAEGVESSDQVKRLRQIGCDLVQGYFFSRPLPADDFRTFVTEGALRQVG